MNPRIVLTISRSWSEWDTVRSVLKTVRRQRPDVVLVHGDARRGDRQAAQLWRSFGGVDEPWPAKWDECGTDCRHKRSTYCPYAGYRRNTAMVESAPDTVIAFIRDNSKGASHCAQAAIDAGILTLIYRQGEPGVLILNAIDSEVAS